MCIFETAERSNSLGVCLVAKIGTQDLQDKKPAGWLHY